MGRAESAWENEVTYLTRVSIILMVSGIAGLTLFFFRLWFTRTYLGDPYGQTVSWLWVALAGTMLTAFLGFLGLLAGDAKPTAVFFGAVALILGSLLVVGSLGAMSQVYPLNGSVTNTEYAFSFTTRTFPYLEIGIGWLVIALGEFLIFGPSVDLEEIEHIPAPQEREDDSEKPV